MEKRSPHYKLAVVRALAGKGQVQTTRTAREGATALGIDFDHMLGVVLALTSSDFYKSMSSHADHHLWQDVYRPQTAFGDVYLKVTVIENLLIVSFKEL